MGSLIWGFHGLDLGKRARSGDFRLIQKEFEKISHVFKFESCP